jgi:hypothetical protein
MARYAAYCGLYCGACCSMIVHEKEQGIASALEVTTEADEQPCQGCNADYKSNCEFVLCNREHGVTNCAFCNEYPCDMITRFSVEEWEHHRVVLTNLDRIKAIGSEAWLQEQNDKWKCPQCSARTIWYQKQCTRCGTEITDYI